MQLYDDKNKQSNWLIALFIAPYTENSFYSIFSVHGHRYVLMHVSKPTDVTQGP